MTDNQLFLADQLLVQGLTFWQNFAAQKAAGTLTQADLDAAVAKLDTDIDTLERDVKDQADAELRSGGG